MDDYSKIEKVIRYLEAHYLEQPSLDTLARVAGVSSFHFLRLFRRWAGTTPKSFLKFLTAQHAKTLLRESRTNNVLSVALDSGLSGPGRLHDLLVSIDSVTPGEYKSGGKGLRIVYGFHSTPFGNCLLGLTERGICHIAFINQRTQALRKLKSEWPGASFELNSTQTDPFVKKIFGSKKRQRISLFLKGTPFQLKVWEALLKIPEGQVVAYADVAACVGTPRASRAVGTAVGKNTIAYLIPCHRVIRETGKIGEYRWGHDRKRVILAWESAKKLRLSDSS